jgi:hypothetical protein
MYVGDGTAHVYGLSQIQLQAGEMVEFDSGVEGFETTMPENMLKTLSVQINFNFKFSCVKKRIE